MEAVPLFSERNGHTRMSFENYANVLADTQHDLDGKILKEKRQARPVLSPKSLNGDSAAMFTPAASKVLSHELVSLDSVVQETAVKMKRRHHWFQRLKLPMFRKQKDETQHGDSHLLTSSKQQLGEFSCYNEYKTNIEQMFDEFSTSRFRDDVQIPLFSPIHALELDQLEQLAAEVFGMPSLLDSSDSESIRTAEDINKAQSPLLDCVPELKSILPNLKYAPITSAISTSSTRSNAENYMPFTSSVQSSKELVLTALTEGPKPSSSVYSAVKSVSDPHAGHGLIAEDKEETPLSSIVSSEALISSGISNLLMSSSPDANLLSPGSQGNRSITGSSKYIKGTSIALLHHNERIQNWLHHSNSFPLGKNRKQRHRPE